MLGVRRDADPKAIKDAFSELALKYHPDRNKEPGAEEKFKEIAEAYAILSDEKKRAEYDARGFAGVSGFSREDLFGGIDFEDLFGGMPGGLGAGLGGGLFERFFGGRRARGPARGASIEVSLEVPLERIAEGGSERVRYSRSERCPECAGTGAKAGTKPRECEVCHGTGRVFDVQRQRNVVLQTAKVCAACGGEGRFIDSPCGRCGAQGRVLREEEIEVKIPPGLEEGTVLRVQGHGEGAEEAGGLPGDLFVHVTSRPDEQFGRVGADLWHELRVPVVDAVLGANYRVPTLKKPVSVRIPAGTQPGTILRLRGKGLPEAGGRGMGDLLVRVAVRVPERPGPEEMRLWEEMKRLVDHS